MQSKQLTAVSYKLQETICTEIFRNIQRVSYLLFLIPVTIEMIGAVVI